MNVRAAAPLMREVRAMAAAFTFLTRLPLGRVIPHDLSDLSRSASYFPLVGLVVGLVGASVFYLALFIWPSTIAVVLSVAATVLLTGAFHEDALADSLDGFGGGWTKDQVLSIMKDSRVGSYALIGVVLVMFAKIASLLSIYDQSNANRMSSSFMDMARVLIAAHVLARWSSILLIRKYEYVRPEEDGAKPAAGRPFVNTTTASQFVLATGISLAIIVPLLGIQAVAAGIAAVSVSTIAGRYFKKRIGGITGDALGAANQMVELSVYLTLAARPVERMFT